MIFVYSEQHSINWAAIIQWTTLYQLSSHYLLNFLPTKKCFDSTALTSQQVLSTILQIRLYKKTNITRDHIKVVTCTPPLSSLPAIPSTSSIIRQCFQLSLADKARWLLSTEHIIISIKRRTSSQINVNQKAEPNYWHWSKVEITIREVISLHKTKQDYLRIRKHRFISYYYRIESHGKRSFMPDSIIVLNSSWFRKQRRKYTADNNI